MYFLIYNIPRSAYGNLAVTGTNLVAIVQSKCCNVLKTIIGEKL